jgi:hypothetical protein
VSTPHPPTPEQQDVETTFRARTPVVLVKAGAGAGKTSTLVRLGGVVEEFDEEAAYLCFNSSTSREAKGRFPRCVQVGTAHSFAKRASNGYWHHRLPDTDNPRPKQKAAVVAQILGITQPVTVAYQRVLQIPEQAYLVMTTVRTFCKTVDAELSLEHVPDINGLDEKGRAIVAPRILELARHAWEDLRLKHGHAGAAVKASNPCDEEGTPLPPDAVDRLAAKAPNLNYEHSYYLKRWQLSGQPIWAKRLGPDGQRQAVKVVFYDECQDANPVTAAIVERMRAEHGTRLVFVGDSNQAINGFTGAIDVAPRYPEGPGIVHLPLTKSFRFGPALAAEANLFLTLLASPLRIEGHDPVPTVIGPVEKPDAILARTNAGAMRAVIESQKAGTPVYLEGGAEEIKALAYAAIDLDKSGWTSHKDLKGMTSWDQVVDYAREGELGAEDLEVAVRLIEEFTPEVVLDAVKKLNKRARRGDLVVCTAHKSKGLEWDHVRIADDFRQPRHTEGREVAPDREELMLSYVAITRGRLGVELGSLGWARDFLARHGVVVAPPATATVTALPTPQEPLQPAAEAPAADPLHRAVAVLRAHRESVRVGASDDASDAAVVRAIIEAYAERPAGEVLAAIQTLRAS